ncbi:MAG: cytochrome c maturation protein CcmE [Chloroflexota bacterium]
MLGEQSRNVAGSPVQTRRKQGFLRRWRFVIAGLVVILIIGTMIFQAIASTGMYYLTVSELKAMSPDTRTQQQVRLGGTVREGSVQWQAATTTLRFSLEDGHGQSLPVVYKGILPDSFKPGAEVILEGRQSGADTFEAKTLLTKCPSKYLALDG